MTEIINLWLQCILYCEGQIHKQKITISVITDYIQDYTNYQYRIIPYSLHNFNYIIHINHLLKVSSPLDEVW